MSNKIFNASDRQENNFWTTDIFWNFCLKKKIAAEIVFKALDSMIDDTLFYAMDSNGTLISRQWILVKIFVKALDSCQFSKQNSYAFPSFKHRYSSTSDNACFTFIAFHISAPRYVTRRPCRLLIAAHHSGSTVKQVFIISTKFLHLVCKLLSLGHQSNHMTVTPRRLVVGVLSSNDC